MKIPTLSTEDKIDPKSLRKSYLESMEKSLEDSGVVFFDETNLNINKEYLVLPPEITEVPSKELGEYLSALTQQKVYLRTLLGRADLAVEAAKRDYLIVSDPLYRKHSRDKLSETAKDRIVNADPDVLPLFNRYVDLKKKYGLVEISIANIEDLIFLVSREITRRTGDFAGENRVYNVENSRRRNY